MSYSPRIIRITTVPISLHLLLKGQMRFMKEHGYDVIMISSPGPEAEAVEREESCEMITLPMKRTVSIAADLVSLYRLYKIFRVLKPDIVHSHTPKAGLLSMVAAKFASVPIRLHTVAGIPWIESRFLMRFIYKNVEKITAWASHRLYANSAGMLQFLKFEGITSDPLKLKLLGNGSSNGIDCNYFNKNQVDPTFVSSLKIKSNLKSGGKIWIFIGRIVKDKGITELVNAFIQYQQFYPNDQLWLVGDEERMRDPLSNDTSSKIELNDSIIHWGHQDDIRPYLVASYALVFPSYREGFPNVPMQAAAMGCPLILSDIDGCNEIVEHGNNGLLIKPKEIQSIVSAMTYLRENPNTSEKFASLSLKKISENYKQDVIWELLLKEYNDFLAIDTILLHKQIV